MLIEVKKKNMSSKVGLAIALATIVVIGLICNTHKQIEHFDYAGLTLTRPPNWWFPQKYDTKKWLSVYYPDQMQQPNCVWKNRGDPRVLNYESSSYRFWRF